MRPYRHIFVLTLILAASCTKVCRETAQVQEVGLCVAGNSDVDANTKTAIGGDGVSVNWSASDRIYLWARNEGNKYVLAGQEFKVYGMAGNYAYFTSTLAKEMADGTYDYLAVCPKPSSASGTKITFSLPSTQNGNGEGIMISGHVSGEKLRPVADYVETKGVSLKMKQMLHLLQLYVFDLENKLGGEKVEKIRLIFPSPVTGSATFDVAESSPSLTTTGTDNIMYIIPETAVAKSSEYIRNYVFATIFPFRWQNADVISARLYTKSKIADTKDINLGGRFMQSGHATPVRLVPDKVGSYCKFIFKLAGNPIGEDLTSITLTAPEGCKWGDKGTNSYTFTGSGTIPVGTSFEIDYEEENYFRTLSSKTITVTYDSEHVRMKSTITFPSLSGKYNYTANLTVPQILYEDFSKVPTFSSYDEYSTGTTGTSHSAYSFLNGWTGGRIGAQAGKCIRIACRRETSADYDARVDSAPLNCTFKKNTDINVAFSFGSNNRYGGIPIITDGNVGQNCYIGYVTSTTGYESGDGTGTFERSVNTFYTKEYTGSYTNTPNETDFTIHNIPAGTSPVRITWHTEVEHQAGTTNTTAWLYIDNIKVTIAK